MKRILINLLIAIYPLLLIGQVEEFKVPNKNDGFFDKTVNLNDTILVKEQRAHILSIKSYEAYNEFKQNYIDCLDERNTDLNKIQGKLTDFDNSLDKLIKEFSETEGLSDDILSSTEKELTAMLTDLNANIHSLKTIQQSIDEADKRLEEIRKELKKERTKLFWRKIGDIIIAGGLGVLIGATFFGG